MFPSKSFMLAIIATVIFCGEGYGQRRPDPRVPDQNGFLRNDPCWITNGWLVNSLMLDGNQDLRVFVTGAVLATPVNGINHDVDSKGTGHSHWHFRDDFLATAPPGTLSTQAQANAYWDQRFQTGKPGNPTRATNATNRCNCFAWALDYNIARGSYVYWLDDENGTGMSSGEVIAAFRADAEAVPKADLAADDVLLYMNGTSYTHATGVTVINCGPPRTPIRISWKYNVSGIYIYATNSLNTPMVVYPAGTRFAVGQPLPNTGQWQAGGAGSENQLSPAGKVWQAQPKQN